MPLLAWYGLVAALIFGAGAAASWKVTSDHYEARAAKDDRVALEDFETAVLGMNQLSAALEVSKGESKIVYKTIEKRIPRLVERAVYLRECVDDDGLRLINEAIAGKLHTGEPVKPLPAPDATGK
ncbi:hypothetical protein [Nitrosovibrio sp. Nv4]|uniref:hypothetical protein n=1 Tax=Nitrosovibrio sp. Nv4 TaxID=1945880 RepID=UPI000BDD1BF3|nr:hypothetical protein [Nitrosovibrio sp. Nv4]SOD41304.1 hypothetical protein SAMN06298226_1599 [Nitrosovibrio sp. Nv4]